MNRYSPHVFLFVVVAVASCGGSGSPGDQSLTGGSLTGAGVLVTTDQGSYQAGRAVRITIHNQESEWVTYNACTRELEVRVGANWVPGPASLRLCTREVTQVDAGAIREDVTDLDLGLVPGDYRLVISFGRGYAPEGEVIRAVSNAFTIIP
jgi:hypothetical protein